MNEANPRPSGVFVEIDALLDTRLATIARLNPSAAAELVCTERYENRLEDDFSDFGITKKQFREAYDQRDVVTLRGATLTNAAMLLSDIVREVELEHINTPLAEAPRVVVNVWPYDLSEEVKHEIRLAVMHFAGMDTPVSIVHMSYEEISLEWMWANFGGALMYDFHKWFALNYKKFQKNPMPDFSFIVPHIFVEKVPPRETWASPEMRDDVTSDMMLKAYFLGLFDYNAVPAKVFCIRDPHVVTA